MVRPEFLRRVLQAAREHEDLLLRIEGRVDAETRLGGLQVRVAVLGQPLVAGEVLFVGDPHQGEGVAQKGGIGRADALGLLGQRLGDLQGPVDALPGIAGFRREAGVGGHLGAELAFRGGDAGHGLGVLEAGPVARDGLQAVLDAEDLGVDLAGGLGRGLPVGHQRLLPALHGLQAHR